MHIVYSQQLCSSGYALLIVLFQPFAAVKLFEQLWLTSLQLETDRRTDVGQSSEA